MATTGDRRRHEPSDAPDRPGVGVSHPTVVPENFDPEEPSGRRRD